MRWYCDIEKPIQSVRNIGLIRVGEPFANEILYENVRSTARIWKPSVGNLDSPAG